MSASSRVYFGRNQVERFAISQNIYLDAVFTRFILYVLLESICSVGTPTYPLLTPPFHLTALSFLCLITHPYADPVYRCLTIMTPIRLPTLSPLHIRATLPQSIKRDLSSKPRLPTPPASQWQSRLASRIPGHAYRLHQLANGRAG
jgi:hypothetical protein